MCRRSASFHQQHAHIVSNGEKELAKVFSLLGALGDKIKPLDLGEAFDQAANLGAKQLVDFLPRRRRVLNRVMQHGSHDGGVVELHVGQNGGNFERMREIRIAGGALLHAMGAHRVNIGTIEKVFIRLRIVPPHAVNEFILPHHGLEKSRFGASNETPEPNIGPEPGRHNP